jgi:hypothetical protein
VSCFPVIPSGCQQDDGGRQDRRDSDCFLSYLLASSATFTLSCNWYIIRRLKFFDGGLELLDLTAKSATRLGKIRDKRDLR